MLPKASQKRCMRLDAKTEIGIGKYKGGKQFQGERA